MGTEIQVRADKKAAEERDIENKELLDLVKEAVGEGLTKAKLSDKLASRPCALSTEGGITLEMERYFRHGPSAEMRNIKANRVLELNPTHSAFTALKEAFDRDDKEKTKKLAQILYALAELSAGVEVEDPAVFTDLVSELF